MAIILSVNSGSSSLKFQMFDMPEATTRIVGQIEKIGLDDSIITFKYNGNKIQEVKSVANHTEAVHILLEALQSLGVVDTIGAIRGVGHRVVHGGERFSESVVITDSVKKDIAELASLAPLHNPVNLVGIEAFMTALPEAVHVAVFDTAFHQTMEPANYLYPIPYQYYEKYKIRRYGFHGTSHAYVSKRLGSLNGTDASKQNVITLHLGNGASITAIENGKSIMTSMGFTPLAGIMMGTRSGDIDPAIMTYLVEAEGITSEAVLNILNQESGMLGVSGISSDARDIIDAEAQGNAQAHLTLDLYANRVAETVGSYFVKLGRVDALIFTGGIGENAGVIRERILKRLESAMNLNVDYALNKSVFGEEVKISCDQSASQVWVIPTNEELVLAQDAFNAI